MADKYRVVVHHPSTDTYWYSKFEELDKEGFEDLFKAICEAGDYFTFNNGNGSSHFFPKNMIQECVFTLEKSEQND